MVTSYFSCIVTFQVDIMDDATIKLNDMVFLMLMIFDAPPNSSRDLKVGKNRIDCHSKCEAHGLPWLFDGCNN